MNKKGNALGDVAVHLGGKREAKGSCQTPAYCEILCSHSAFHFRSMGDDNLNLLRKTIMYKSFLSRILAASLMVGLFGGAGLVLPANAAEYRNPAVAGEESPSYWLDRGALLATYGNYPAAIKAYKKALALDPDLSSAYFNLALAHFGNGELGQALATINQALIMDPDNGRYLYGRGWILLQGFGAHRADADFQWAAELGNQDALDYLKGRDLKSPPHR